MFPQKNYFSENIIYKIVTKLTLSVLNFTNVVTLFGYQFWQDFKFRPLDIL